MNLKKVVAGLAVGLSVFGVATVEAATLSLQDDDIDFALSFNPTTQQYTVLTSGTIGVGTILVSVFEIPTVQLDGASIIPAGSELTGVAAVQITGGDGSLETPWTFSAVTAGLNSILALGTVDATVVGGQAGGGATIAMWFNSTTPDLEVERPGGNCGNLAGCIDAASVGDLFQVDGFAGDPDEFWTSTQAILNGDDIATVAGTNNSLIVANFNAAQTTLFQGFGLTIGGQSIGTGDPCINIGGNIVQDGCIVGGVVSGAIQGGAGVLVEGAFAHSDFDAGKLTVAVPEPGTLLLLGVGLLGVGALRRRS